MNFKRVFPIIALASTLYSCNFNEDYCIRDGELVAYCDFGNLDKTLIPNFNERHLMAYGTTAHSLPVTPLATFSDDTLYWKIPQGTYDFIFFTGNNYRITNKEDYQRCSLTTDLEEKDNKVYLKKNQNLVLSALFTDKLIYQQTTYREIKSRPFSQEIKINLHLEGDLVPLDSISCELDGISISKGLKSREPSEESGILQSSFLPIKEDKTLWGSTNHVLGIGSNDNELRIKTHTNNLSDASYYVDLTPYLKDFELDKITIDLKLKVGKSLEIQAPILIEDWVTGEVVEVELTPIA